MKEWPIIFSSPMVRAILEGRKRQTRRIVKLRKGQEIDNGAVFSASDPFAMVWPRGKVGDRLWVRENFYVDHCDYTRNRLPKVRPDEVADDMLFYPADAVRTGKWCCQLIPECCCGEVGKPHVRSSIYMPRWASRIDLEITGMRVEHLQDISEDDAIDEGCEMEGDFPKEQPHPHGGGVGWDDAREWFSDLWESINGEGSWANNPWVWCISFKRLTTTPSDAKDSPRAHEEPEYTHSVEAKPPDRQSGTG